MIWFTNRHTCHLFTEPQQINYLHRGNSIVKTIPKCINKSAGGSGYIESIVKIPLPEATGPFEFTPDEISGHFCFEPIIREHRTISAKSCLIFMFDLRTISKDSSQSYRQREVAQENFDYY